MKFLSKNLDFLVQSSGLSTDEFCRTIDEDSNSWNEFQNSPQSIKAKTLDQISTVYGYSIDALLNIDIAVSKINKTSPSNYKMLVLDVDGTLTDGGMVYSENGDEFKRFNTQDGMFIKRLTKTGFQVAFLSGGLSPVIAQNRANMLGVQRVSVHATASKLETLTMWCEELGFKLSEVAYIGDDVNDVEVMQHVGLSVCPANAVPSVKEIANIILRNNGGDACVREFIENYL